MVRPALAQSLPDLQARGEAFIQALNTGDADVWAAYGATYQGVSEDRVDRMVAILSEFYLKHRGLERTTIRKRYVDGAPRFVSVLGKSRRTSDWYHFQFFLAEAPPYAMEMLFLSSAVEPVDLPKGTLDDSAVLDWVDAYVQSLHEENDFSGAVLIAQSGEPLLYRQYGFENHQTGQAVTEKTRFNLGSGNKMFTAVAIAQLEEQGLLSYDDTIAKHLPDYPNKDVGSRVTIHQLLTHTSGLGDYWTDDYEEHWHEIDTLQEVLPFFQDAPLQFEPGSDFAYSNAGFLVLGLIIEAVSGQEYFSYIREHVYRPAGMTESGSFRRDARGLHLAAPHERPGHFDTSVPWQIARQGRRGTSAGGGYSTPRDILRFDDALYGGRLVSEEGRHRLHMVHAGGTLGQISYGYGFVVEEADGHTVVGHGGQAPGMYFWYGSIYPTGASPQNRYTVIVFSNHADAVAPSLAQTLKQLATQAP